jgi:hypothetical protein
MCSCHLVQGDPLRFEILRMKEVLQHVLHIYIEYMEYPIDCFEELACRIMPQMPAGEARSGQDLVPGFPTLSFATFIIWY